MLMDTMLCFLIYSIEQSKGIFLAGRVGGVWADVCLTGLRQQRFVCMLRANTRK